MEQPATSLEEPPANNQAFLDEMRKKYLLMKEDSSATEPTPMPFAH